MDSSFLLILLQNIQLTWMLTDPGINLIPSRDLGLINRVCLLLWTNRSEHFINIVIQIDSISQRSKYN
jgi:hypothetical protein